MFVFDDLYKLDDRGLQKLLRELSKEKLMVAMKGASKKVINKIYKNISKRARELLKEDLELMPPVRVCEVEKAQKDIVKIARMLVKMGEIYFVGKDKEELI